MYYNYYPYYKNNISYSNRYLGGFLVPFGLGFLTAPLVLNPKPNPYYYNYPYYYKPY